MDAQRLAAIKARAISTYKGEVVGQIVADVLALLVEYERMSKALQPFTYDLTEWRQYVESGGEMSLVEYFTDYLDDEVLLAHMEAAQKAISE